MGSGLEFLHKILKDKTRRKIVRLLNEKGALSHTDLIEELDFINNGRLNYHLKQLNDLLTKDTNRRYILTEKGKLAIRLLTEFPEQNRQQLGLKPKWWRRFWIGIGATALLLTVANSLGYFLGYVNPTMILRSYLAFFSLIGSLYMMQHVTLEVLSEKNRFRVLTARNLAIIIGSLALMVVAVVMFLVPFMAESYLNQVIVRLFWLVPAVALVGIAVYLKRRGRLGRDAPVSGQILRRMLIGWRVRAIYPIGFGSATGFMLSGIVVFLLGQPLPRTYSIPLFFAFCGVGAVIGELIGKKVDYRWPIWAQKDWAADEK